MSWRKNYAINFKQATKSDCTVNSKLCVAAVTLLDALGTTAAAANVVGSTAAYGDD